jgi:ubiquinone/menaquinone biosynthesis C-methylase UbiE
MSLHTGMVSTLRAVGLFNPVRDAYRFIRNLAFRIRGDGLNRFNAMQKREYRRYTSNIEDAKNLCVGMFSAHEDYPYEDYLLRGYAGPYREALDFGCGIGRMMNRMLKHFESTDGIDLMQENLDFARQYLSCENNISEGRYRLYKSDGLGCKIEGMKYDFIYSTICLQHIPVYEVRRKIFEDFFDLLKPAGACCLQLGFGWNSGVMWFDNFYAASGTNAQCDVSIPSESFLPAIQKDFESIGFKNVRFQRAPSPHPEISEYHNEWLFIYLTR